MGFPENFRKISKLMLIYANLGKSYKQIGNSICVPVEAIAQEITQQSLLENLLESTKSI